MPLFKKNNKEVSATDNKSYNSVEPEKKAACQSYAENESSGNAYMPALTVHHQKITHQSETNGRGCVLPWVKISWAEFAGKDQAKAKYDCNQDRTKFLLAEILREHHVDDSNGCDMKKYYDGVVIPQ